MSFDLASFLPVNASHEALASLGVLLAPLARLAVTQGVKFQALEELLKTQLVEAAQAEAQVLQNKITTSAISLATGLQRPDVVRLMAGSVSKIAKPIRKHSYPAVDQIFTRWLADASYMDAAGKPKPLLRDAANCAPGTFDALCRSISQNVHPKTVQAELVRLRMAEVQTSKSGEQSVALLVDNFTPSQDHATMLALLAGNAGAHLQAAVSNVLTAQKGFEPLHLEQSVSSDAISLERALSLQRLIKKHWQSIKTDSIPILEAAELEQASSPSAAAQRLRFGVYVYRESAHPSNKESLHEN